MGYMREYTMDEEKTEEEKTEEEKAVDEAVKGVGTKRCPAPVT